jgi:transcriptional regulator with XRE-family HTH domain
MSSVAELVDNLFRTYKRPDGREYTHKEVSVALGGLVEPSHLSKLRNGKITNPGRDTLLLLCRFFKVSPVYFFPELDLPASSDGQVAQQQQSLSAVLRSVGLSPQVQEKIEELIRALKE